MNKKQLNEIPSYFPVVIIGGGINGAGIFRDLSLHNISCLLIEKFEFSSQTSRSSSKMLHGGIRYLENFDFGLVKEALHEKNLWLKLAPHLCYEEEFILPVYKSSLRPKWMLKCGLFFYDFLSGFQNKPHYMISAEETAKRLPGIKEQELLGSGVYSDAVVDDERLTIECIKDGLHHSKSYACNFTSLQAASKKEKKFELTLKDEHSGEERQITCKQLIFTTGPFTDNLLTNINLFPWTKKLILSQGSHLWIKKESLPISSPVVLTPDDGRVIFVIPQKEKVLVGTTEVPTQAKFNLQASESEIQYLLANINEYFPKYNLNNQAIISTFSGIRPLVKDDEEGLGKVARNHKIFRPSENAYVLLGGKYTTFRVMASQVASQVLRKLNLPYNSNLSKSPFRN